MDGIPTNFEPVGQELNPFGRIRKSLSHSVGVRIPLKAIGHSTRGRLLIAVGLESLIGLAPKW